MAKVVKKAQDGDTLRRGQYKRIGRIAEKNPDRADRVASRMNERASRVERGKDIAGGGDRGGRNVLNWMGRSLGEEARKEASDTMKKQKRGGSTSKAKDGKWIQKAVNPKHKGYCTPMTKATCTPKRKALAVTLKKMAKSRKGK